MPALFFPNSDALRLALVNGLVPAAVARGPARGGIDDIGHIWLELETPLARESLTALGRLGVLVLGSPGVATHAVRSWAELVPLRRIEPLKTGTVLFDVPDRHLAALVGRLERTRTGTIGVRLLSEPPGRAWVTAIAPPVAVFLWLAEVESDIRVYLPQAEGVWALRGYSHPLATHLSVPDGSVLLCAPDCATLCVVGPIPEARSEELALRPRPIVERRSDPLPRIGVRFRLVRADAPADETFWVLTPPQRAAFERFCQTTDERLARRFQIATVSADGQTRLLVRRADADDGAAVLPVPARGYRCDPRLASLFVPAGYALRPTIRVRELARELGTGANRLVWVEPAEGNGLAVHTVAASAFRPLHEQMEYAAPPPAMLAASVAPEEPFGFERFAIQVETSIELDPDPEPVRAESSAPAEPSEEGDEGETSWVSKSVARVVQWVRGRRERNGTDGATEPAEPNHPDARRAPTGNASAGGRVERTLASADALLHGHDRAARRHELETRLLADSPRLDPAARATRWAELAGMYGATGQALDAAVCWTNALWECPTPPEEWLEQWAAAECRAAKPGARGADLERWLGEPARPGTGRVVAALAAQFGFRSAPPPGFLAALPRVLAVLEQQFDDIPVRGAWLARLAVARSCDGDVLGLARWRDRVVRRLHERGPALDLDEPSFLRFRGTATAERFKTAREWLVRMHEPILRWVRRHAEGGRGLEWAGLDGEGEATTAYAQFLLAWGLGALGERARAREWAAKARKSLAGATGKSLAGATGPRPDPAGHAFLGDLFLHRIREAHEGRAPKPVLPPELQTRLERLPEFARYSVDRLREHCRVLQPVGAVRAYRGRDLKEFWGADLLGQRLSILGTRTDPAQLNDEARALLALAAAEPSTETVPRIAFALLDVAPALESATLGALLELVPTALDWTEAWLRPPRRWTDAERPDRAARFRARMIEAAFAIAPPTSAQRLLRHLTRGAATGALLAAAVTAAPRIFRAARKHALIAEAEALMHALDPAPAEFAGPVTAERIGFAVGWFVAGNEENGNRVLNAARESLVYAVAPDDLQKRTAVALAYAEALGFVPAGIALGRLEELFQQLDRVTVHCSSNCYFTLQPLRLIDTVVRAVVTDEFTLGPSVRAWLDGDEFLIRRRVHHDMTALLRESELG